METQHCPICNHKIQSNLYGDHIHACYFEDCKTKGLISECNCEVCTNKRISIISGVPENSEDDVESHPKKLKRNQMQYPILGVHAEQSLFDLLPIPILNIIFRTFDKYDCFVGSLVCKRWNSLITRDQSVEIKDLFTHFSELGSLSVLKWLRYQTSLYRTIHIDNYEHALYNAAKRNHLEVVKWLVENGCVLSEAIYHVAAQTGSLEFCKWLEQNQCPRSDITDMASRSGNLDLVKWFISKGANVGPGAFENAAEKGHWHILKWLRKHGYKWDSGTCSSIAYHGSLEILKWARKLECPWDEETCELAAWNGRLEILKWARLNECPWDSKTINQAASNGHFDTVKWLIENNCPMDNETFSEATSKAPIEMLEYLKQKGCIISSTAYQKAAENGNLALLNWLYDNRVPLDDKIDEYAVRCENMAVFEWLKDKGFSWSPTILKEATCNYNAFKWLRQNGCPWDDKTFEYCYGDTSKSLKWALKRGCPVNMSKSSENAGIFSSCLKVLKVLKQYNCKFTVGTSKNVARRGHIRVLSWLVQNGAPLDYSVYAAAKETGQIDAMAWLELHGCPTKDPEAEEDDE